MQPPEQFPFPFTPYEIQENFMTELYKCLENGNLGVFESPTGTGKSLSIICGALKWLMDHQNSQRNNLESDIAVLEEKSKTFEKSSDGWFSVQTEQLEINKQKQALQTKLNAMLKFRDKRKQYAETVKKQYDKHKDLQKRARAAYKRKGSSKEEKQDADELGQQHLDEDLLLEDAHRNSESSEDEDDQKEIFRNTKIFFCSRTHSQLSQFIGELKRSPYSEDLSVVVLASRQSYCINKAVRKLKHTHLINEQCLQMQRKKVTVKQEKDIKRSKGSSGCPLMPGDQQLLMAKILTDIHDVEEVVQIGTELNTCCYYTSRKSVEDGQLILVPYNTILHKDTRISSGIDLQDNILIIDEAHNLLEAIERMHSACVTGRNLLHCFSQLSQYQKRFQTLFSAKNMLYMSQLSFCLKKLLSVFGATSKSYPSDKTNCDDTTPKLYKIEEFEVTTQIDTINIFELLNFIRNSKLIHKLQGFTEQYGSTLKIHESAVKKSGVSEFLSSIKTKDTKTEQEVADVEQKIDEDQISNPMVVVLGFLECLKSSCADGRIVVIPGPTIGQGTIKFLLLNPAAHFHDIVKKARAVVLAGGTMEPMSEFVDQLFLTAGAAPERIVTYSCDHVIHPENIICNIVTQGPTGTQFEFSYQHRQDTKLLHELGRTLINICNIVPAGIVVFLPSYNYEETVYKHLEKSGVITKINAKKRIFREPKSALQVNEVLEQYACSVKNPQSPQNGSLLFSVVGGKLSEGLNFSDDLGRCVIVVGMPYPNVTSPELREKMKYLNENVKSGAGQVFYENCCMKAVNQCIGRAVRHINDYSAVVLLDKRYSSKTKALPRWIQRSLTINNTFGAAIGSMAKFFAKKKK